MKLKLRSAHSARTALRKRIWLSVGRYMFCDHFRSSLLGVVQRDMRLRRVRGSGSS